MIKVLDVGYGYLKWVNEGNVLKRQALVTVIPPGSLENRQGLDTIVIDGVEYLIGHHDFENLQPVAASNTRNRVEDLEYKVLFLYAIAAQADGADIATDILTGLPIHTMNEEAPILIDVFANKTFDVEYKGKSFTLSIGDVIVIPQGYGSSLYLTSSNPVLKTENVLVSDIGFQTNNYVYMQKGNLFNDLADTHQDLGIGSAYEEIAKIVNKKTRSRKNYTKYDMDYVLDNGATVLDKNSQPTKIHFQDDIDVIAVLDKQAKKIWSDIKNRYLDKGYPVDRVVFVGGSAASLKERLLDNQKRDTLFPGAPQDLQVLGYDLYARSMSNV